MIGPGFGSDEFEELRKWVARAEVQGHFEHRNWFGMNDLRAAIDAEIMNIFLQALVGNSDEISAEPLVKHTPVDSSSGVTSPKA